MHPCEYILQCFKGKAEFKAEIGKEAQNNWIEAAGKSPLFHSHPKTQISLEASDGAVRALSPSEAAEKCEVCGLRAVEYKVYFEGQWLKRCSQCLERMKASGLRLHYLPLTEGETNEA